MPIIPIDQLPGKSTVIPLDKLPSSSAEQPQGQSLLAKSEPYVRPALEAGGLLFGGAAGSVVGPLGSVAGGGLGYAAGKNTADVIYGKDTPQTITDAAVKTAKDVGAGAAMEAGGQALGKALPWVFSKAGSAAKAVMGRLTGTGSAAIDDAVAAGEKMGGNPFKDYSDFDRTLRGKITGEEVVENAQSVLRGIKDARGAAYVQQLEKIKADPTVLQGAVNNITTGLKKLIGKDGFDIQPQMVEGKLSFDFSRSTLVESQPVINKALQDVAGWDDLTAVGLDTLKKRLSTYAGQVKKGTPQFNFLTRLENMVATELKTVVPGYAEMTKGYGEATKLIKDVEAGLMMRKQGMTGRIVADQTLRRLLSSTKDNFPLRRDLVQALSTGGQDISGQISGYAMRSVVPVGIAGSGPALIGNAALAQFVHPGFWPVLAASSPRLSAEFLRMFGKTLSTVRGTGPIVGKGMAYALNPERM